MVLLVLQGLQEIQDHKDQLDYKVCQGLMVHQGLQGPRVSLVPKVHKDFEEHQEQRA